MLKNNIRLFNYCNLDDDGRPTVSSGSAPVVSVLYKSTLQFEDATKFLTDTEEKRFNLAKYPIMEDGKIVENKFYHQQIPKILQYIDKTEYIHPLCHVDNTKYNPLQYLYNTLNFI